MGIDPGQVIVAGFKGTEAPSALRRALADGELGGAILFRRNLTGVAQAHDLCRSLEGPTDRPPLIGVDQEGGRVVRLGEPVLQLPSMQRLGARADPAFLRDVGRALGKQLSALGFTMNFAPVLDVHTNDANPVIGDRAFGTTPGEVVERALPFAEGLMQGGVDPCGKHFPGHGDTDQDSHYSLPRLKHARPRLDRVELTPFRAATWLPAWMSAHVVFEELDPEMPATFSRTVMQQLVREELGYDGVLISDDLEMKAVAADHTVAQSAVRAIDAGCDMVLICSDLEGCFAAREALGRRAAADPSFAERLRVACERGLRLRRARPSTPASDLSGAFAIDEELRTRLEVLFD